MNLSGHYLFYLYAALFAEISDFNKKVNSLVEVLEKHATRIDDQKSKVRIALASSSASVHFITYVQFVGDWPPNGV
jgi:hypothetical protein